MRVQAFVHLGADAAAPCRWWVSEDAAVSREGRGTLAEAAAALGDGEVVVLVPGQQTLLTDVDLPGRSRGQRLKAAPYALEEDLARDIDELHFAYGDQRADRPLSVCVVDRQRMDGWVRALDTAGLAPRLVTPDILALPQASGRWSVARVGDHALVRTGDTSGFASDLDNLPLALALAASDPAVPEAGTLTLLTTPEAAAVADAVPPPAMALDPGGEPRSLAAWLSAGFRPEQAIDLLQGAYARRTTGADPWRPWQAAAALLGLWLAVAGGFTVADHARLKREHALLDARIEAAFRHALPDVSRMVNPRVQVEQRLRAVTAGGAGQAAFLPLLAAAGEVLAARPGVRLTGMSYGGDRLVLDLELPALQQLEALEAALEERGLGVAIERAVAQQGRASSSLAITGGRS